MECNVEYNYNIIRKPIFVVCLCTLSDVQHLAPNMSRQYFGNMDCNMCFL